MNKGRKKIRQKGSKEEEGRTFKRDREGKRKGGLGRKMMFSLRDIELLFRHGFTVWSSRERPRKKM